MRSLLDYINNERVKTKVHPINKEFSEYTFENFVIDIGDVGVETEKLWDIYVSNRYTPVNYMDRYPDYSEWFYEAELYVSSPETVEKELEKFDNYFDRIEKTNENKSDSKFYFLRLYGDIDALIELTKLNSFIELMNITNWSAYLSDNCILLKPNKTNNITDIVYSFDYIYHYCPRFIYEDKISKYGINPKHKFAFKYEKVYCFYSKKPSEDMQQWARIKYRLTDNQYKKAKIKSKNFVILKIDLNKCKTKIRFWEDEESNSKYTFYTFEPIPPFAIIDVIDMNVKYL